MPAPQVPPPAVRIPGRRIGQTPLPASSSRCLRRSSNEAYLYSATVATTEIGSIWGSPRLPVASTPMSLGMVRP